jgi:hypothetical protein
MRVRLGTRCWELGLFRTKAQETKMLGARIFVAKIIGARDFFVT